MEWFIVVWLFVVGACVGSFLNVVVYRVPAGKSLLYPPSHCPACGHAIRARHNVPVLGWLILHGRCFDCDARISSRYPLMELITGCAFLFIAVPEFGLGGSNLFNPRGDDWTLQRMCGVYAIHVGLMCILLVAGQIAWDGQRVPLGMLIVSIVLASVALLAIPQLKPLLIAGGMRFEPPSVAIAVRIAAGSFAGLLTRPAMPRGPAGRRRTAEMSLCLALVAVVLGWQAVSQVTALSAAVYLVAHWFGRRNRFIAGSPRVAYVALATFLSILFVKPLLEWLTQQGRSVELAICGGLLAAAHGFSWLARLARSSDAAPQSAPPAAQPRPDDKRSAKSRRKQRKNRPRRGSAKSGQS